MSDLHLPSLNAALNSLSTVLIVAGITAIKRGRIAIHKACMAGALASSTLFLASYLYHHYHAGTTRFAGSGSVRAIYLAILLSHTILAAAIVPMVIGAVSQAWRGRWESHRRWGGRTWPLWLYVSVTGVVIYWMLYRM